MGNLFQELKRRKVFRVAAVYVVVAWVLIQVVDVILPTFGAPDWVNKTIIFVFVLGFPLALILSWAYEITPEGIKSDSETQQQAVAAPSSDRNLIYAILVLVLLVAGFQIADRFLLTPSTSIDVSGRSDDSQSSRSTIRSEIYLGRAAEGIVGNRATVAISPDGSRISYVIRDETGLHLFLRELDQLEPRLLITLSGQSSSTIPFFSPDSEQIAYRDGNRLMRISVRGDSPQTLATGLSESAIAWESDQSIIYTDGEDQRLNRISSVGGEPERIDLTIDPGEDQLVPHVLPDGRGVLYSEGSGRLVTRGIRLADLETGEVRTLIERGYAGRYVASGHILFMRSATLWAAPFDLDALETSGPAVPVVQGIQATVAQGYAHYSVSNDGRLIYRPGTDLFTGEISNNLVWVDRDGREEIMDVEPGRYLSPQISPDGEFVSVTIRDDNGDSDIWIYDLRRGMLNRLTNSGAASGGIWTRDGSQIVYGSSENEWGTWIVDANGAGQPELLIGSDDMIRVDSFSPDGQCTSSNVVRTALDDTHKNQTAAQKILMDRVLPISTFDKGTDFKERINIIISTIPTTQEKEIN